MSITAPSVITIALVDDSVPLRTLIGTYLSRQGFDIICEAASGEELLSALHQAERVPELCLLDTNMPGMGGMATARRLATDFPSVRIMAYSFFDDDSDDTARNMLENGAHDFISKEEPAKSVSNALKTLHLRQSIC